MFPESCRFGTEFKCTISLVFFFIEGLEELVHLGKLPLEALQSSAVIRKINMAFDMVNSSSFRSGPKSVIYAHLLQSKLEVGIALCLKIAVFGAKLIYIRDT